MSSFETDLITQASQEQVVHACRYALGDMQVVIKQDNGISFLASEKLKMLGFTNPAKIEVRIQQVAGGQKILVKTSNAGFGPIQGSHVAGVAETFLSIFQYKLNESKSEAPKSGVADELMKLAKLKEQGLLSDDEFAAAKAKLL